MWQQRWRLTLKNPAHLQQMKRKIVNFYIRYACVTDKDINTRTQWEKHQRNGKGRKSSLNLVRTGKTWQCNLPISCCTVRSEVRLNSCCVEDWTDLQQPPPHCAATMFGLRTTSVLLGLNLFSIQRCPSRQVCLRGSQGSGHGLSSRVWPSYFLPIPMRPRDLEHTLYPTGKLADPSSIVWKMCGVSSLFGYPTHRIKPSSHASPTSAGIRWRPNWSLTSWLTRRRRRFRSASPRSGPGTPCTGCPSGCGLQPERDGASGQFKGHTGTFFLNVKYFPPVLIVSKAANKFADRHPQIPDRVNALFASERSRYQNWQMDMTIPRLKCLNTRNIVESVHISIKGELCPWACSFAHLIRELCVNFFYSTVWFLRDCSEELSELSVLHCDVCEMLEKIAPCFRSPELT